MGGAHHHDHSSHDHASHDHVSQGHAAHAAHAHGHGGHGHSHAPASFGRAFAIGIGLNLAYTAVEAFYGLATGSMALLADAGHNLSDVAGLAIAWGAWFASRTRPTPRFTYGLRGSSILAALVNAVLLLIACGAIALEAIQRFAEPAPVPGGTMMIVAGVGIVINLGTALLFARGSGHDINIRGAFLHMAADAAVSAGVVIAGLLTLKTGADWIDPATSLVIVLVIVAGTWGLLRESLAMAMQAVPGRIDPAAVQQALAEVKGVTRVHHLHIWPTSTTETALTAHLVVPGGHPGDAFLERTAAMLHDRFGIGHATLQIEQGEGVGEGRCDIGGCAFHGG
ncbi:cation diffusion facilitator family transporter [Edaphosphingomonas haloaromaticamans]|uniref:Cadmium, cobalt and zinc/H(+)-K(+) antiporter n=1 Tax=Edaphosphingomonas haloaromaticamans TaxID=653954 RepID=A0A1S1HA65_9SPHN|nr:cation diffusion facilitator family transporter [Sphingomonas haloaromaticamans]OHT19024.1 Cadmium, cobalt and zinc/H(+)-K(+) antiporter [Sphingomonas haloaromaticamans]